MKKVIFSLIVVLILLTSICYVAAAETAVSEPIKLKSNIDAGKVAFGGMVSAYSILTIIFPLTIIILILMSILKNTNEKTKEIEVVEEYESYKTGDKSILKQQNRFFVEFIILLFITILIGIIISAVNILTNSSTVTAITPIITLITAIIFSITTVAILIRIVMFKYKCPNCRKKLTHNKKTLTSATNTSYGLEEYYFKCECGAKYKEQVKIPILAK